MALPSCPSPEGPKAYISNEDVAAILHARAPHERARQAADRLLASSGVTRRHWSHWIGGPVLAEEEDAVELAFRASQAALADAGLGIEDIELVLLALSTSTLATVATATPLAARLGHRGPSFDLKAGCAGSLYGLQLASALLATGARRILLVGADTMTRYMDPEALAGFVHVGDGAGALVLEASEAPNLEVLTQGDYETWAVAGMFEPLPPREGARWVMGGKPTALAEHVAKNLQQALRELRGDRPVAAWVSHALGAALLQGLAQQHEPPLPLFSPLAHHGNTGAASLPMALHLARPLPAGPVLLSALGAGMRWGAAYWQDPEGRGGGPG